MHFPTPHSVMSRWELKISHARRICIIEIFKMLQIRDFFQRTSLPAHHYVMYVKIYMHNAITFFLRQGNNKHKIQDSGWGKSEGHKRREAHE